MSVFGTDAAWTGRNPSGVCAAELLAATRKLGNAEVDVIALDMPLATALVVGRRMADSAISRKFGKAWCGTQSPSAIRPGRLSDHSARTSTPWGSVWRRIQATHVLLQPAFILLVAQEGFPLFPPNHEVLVR